MAHARRKFLDAMQTDARAADFINLISELYWIESDCRIRVLTTQEREKERQERSLPILTEMWQKLEPIYNTTKDKTANLFYKAMRYLVNE